MESVNALLEGYRDSFLEFVSATDNIVLFAFKRGEAVFEVIRGLVEREREPLKRVYVNLIEKAFKHVFYGEVSEEDTIAFANDVIQAITGMDILQYCSKASQRVKKEGKPLNLDEVIRFLPTIYETTVFGLYKSILRRARYVARSSEVLLEDTSSLSALEKVLLECRHTKRGTLDGFAYFPKVLKRAYSLQKDSQEPILVFALVEYFKPIFEKVYFAREVVEKLLRRYRRLDGETPFINACEIALGERKEPKSKTAFLLLLR